MKIRSALLLALMALIIAVAAGCAAPAAGGDTNDDAASEMRIVSLMPSNTDILFALGLGEALVGVTDYCGCCWKDP